MVFDSRIPSREECVLGYQLERWAASTPDEVAIIFHGGERWTWAETLELTRRAAKGLQDLGVRRGDHVISWQPNNWEAMLTWFGLNYLGAVYVPMNTAYKGSLLEHTVHLSGATLMVCHADLAPRLEDIDTGDLSDVVVTGGSASLSRQQIHPAEALMPERGLETMPEEVEPWDAQYIIFTSGTTGPSKAVLSSYLQGHSMGPEAHRYLGADERHLVNLPLFHVGGTIFVILTLATGASCFVDSHFKTDEFWSTVREYEVTATCLLAAMIPFLLKLPPSDDERNHTCM